MISSIQNMQNILSDLPGIGTKSAEKLTGYFIHLKNSELETLFTEISALHRSICICQKCHNYALADPCDFCQKKLSEEGIICIIETTADADALKKFLPLGSKFFVLGGKLSPLNGISPEDLHLDSLKEFIQQDGLKEIIIATGSDVESESTASYVYQILKEFPYKVSRIAFGVSVGSNLSHSDERSIQKSLSARIFY